MAKNSKNYVILFLVVGLFLVTFGVFLFFHFKKTEMTMIHGVVIETGENYIILDGGEEDYILETELSYPLGTEVDVQVSSFDFSLTPIVIWPANVVVTKDVSSDSFMEGTVEIYDEPDYKNDLSQDPPSLPEDVQKEPEKEEKPLEIEEPLSEEDHDAVVLQYMNQLEQNTIQEESILKQGFITVVDFLFYQGDIKGVKLQDITLKTKLTVLKVALSIDRKIDEYFPGYKETIGTTTKRIYTGMKEKMISLYLSTTTKICTNNATLCHDAKQDFQSMKKYYGITWSFIKSLASQGVSNLKDWYEIYSGKN